MPPWHMDIDDEEGLLAVVTRIAPHLKRGDVVTLNGDLGVGKTAFARKLIQHLLKTPVEVPSPTFTLVQTYDLPDFQLSHFDLYRLSEEGADIMELGWEETRRFGVALVEWPDRLGGFLPKDRVEIDIRFVKDSDNKRQITVTSFGDCIARFK